MGDYYQRVFMRALSESLPHGERREIGPAVAQFVLSILLIYLWFGDFSEVLTRIKAASVIVATFACFLMLRFAWNLVRVPVLLDRESGAKSDELYDKVQFLEEMRKPRMQLLLQNEQPYVRELVLDVPGMKKKGPFSIVDVGLKNLAPHMLDNCIIYLERLSTSKSNLLQDRLPKLFVREDNKSTFRLSPGEEKRIQIAIKGVRDPHVILAVKEDKEDPVAFNSLYAPPDCTINIVVKAYSNNSQPVEQKILLQVTGDGRLEVGFA